MNYSDAQPELSDLVDGKVIQFLRRNLFTVELRNGVITAAMPERLLPIAVENLEFIGTPFTLRVKVRLNKPPKMHRIIDARPIVLCGGD